MGGEKPKWRIDALDARGGLAFASLRTNHFSEVDATVSPPLVFVGAPAFQPEMIANRSIALAGVRGSFQSRLYIGDDEASFPSLEAIVEFVRRVYLRGGGGDGADGAGGGRPRPLPPTPHERPVLPSAPKSEPEHESLIGEIVRVAGEFEKKSQSHICPLGEFRNVQWPTPSPAADQIQGSSGMRGEVALANAAVGLIYEMMHRMPDARNPVALVRWHEDARRLGYVIAVMGLWPILGTGPYRSFIVNLMKPLRNWKNHAPSSFNSIGTLKDDDELLCFLCSLLFGDGPGLDAPEVANRLLEWIRHLMSGGGRPILIGPRKFGYLSDPMSDLALFPCPSALSQVVRSNALDDVSLYHALVSGVGSPALLASQGFCELVLFAATWVVAHRDRPIMDWLDLRSPAPQSPTTPVHVELKADRGWNWLREHLPAFCFNEKIEHVVAAAAELRYNPAEATSSSNTPPSFTA